MINIMLSPALSRRRSKASLRSKAFMIEDRERTMERNLESDIFIVYLILSFQFGEVEGFEAVNSMFIHQVLGLAFGYQPSVINEGYSSA